MAERKSPVSLNKCMSRCQHMPTFDRVRCKHSCHDVSLTSNQPRAHANVIRNAHQTGRYLTTAKRIADSVTASRDDDNNAHEEHSICRNFCARNRLTTFAQCLTLLCDKPVTDSTLRLAFRKLQQAAGSAQRWVRAGQWATGSAQQLSAGSHHETGNKQRLAKRWPSRISCLEMKCGRFAGNQQRFFDCGVQMCTE